MRSTTLLLAAVLAFSAVVAVAPTASAYRCSYDPDDPVPGILCNVNGMKACVEATLKDEPCPA